MNPLDAERLLAANEIYAKLVAMARESKDDEKLALGSAMMYLNNAGVIGNIIYSGVLDGTGVSWRRTIAPFQCTVTARSSGR